jgi:hypothetical protein
MNDSASADAARLAAMVDSVVVTSPYFSQGRLVVATDADCVIVEGEVPSYFHKQMAQETLLRIRGVRRIDNRLRVTKRSERSAASDSGNVEPDKAALGHRTSARQWESRTSEAV